MWWKVKKVKRKVRLSKSGQERSSKLWLIFTSFKFLNFRVTLEVFR